MGSTRYSRLSLGAREAAGLGLAIAAALLGVKGAAALSGYLAVAAAVGLPSALYFTGPAGLILGLIGGLLVLVLPVVAALAWRWLRVAGLALSGLMLASVLAIGLYLAFSGGLAVLGVATLGQVALALVAGYLLAGGLAAALLPSALLLWLSSPLALLAYRLAAGPVGDVPLALAALVNAFPGSLAVALLMRLYGCRPGTLAGLAASGGLLLLAPFALAADPGVEPLVLALESILAVASMVLLALWSRALRAEVKGSR